jgi:hypothetical protein
MPHCIKRPYPSAKAAALVLRAIKRAQPLRSERGIHPCTDCRAFHLTSARASERNKWTRGASEAAHR